MREAEDGWVDVYFGTPRISEEEIRIAIEKVTGEEVPFIKEQPEGDRV